MSTGPTGTQQPGAQASGSPVTSSAAQQQANTGGVPSTYPGTGVTTTLALPTFSWPNLGSAYVLFLVIYMFLFHVGAGVLSYRKYGSMGWAVLAGFFAYFYYPYYAFTASSPAPEAAVAAPIIGGMLKALKNSKSRRR